MKVNRKKVDTIGQEQCWMRFDLTDTNLEDGTFKGFASVFGSMVQAWMPTIIERGAFTKTLQENASRVKLLYQHDTDMPIGIPTRLVETDKGLEVDGKISKTQLGIDTITLMRDGVLDELSIGFDPIRWEMEDRGDGDVIRHIHECRLWEISLVTFGADPMAKIHTVHAVVPFQNLPLASEGHAWNASAAVGRMKEECAIGGDSPDWTKFRRAFVWYDPDDSEKMGSYKFPIADLIGGKLMAIPRAIFAAAARLGSADIPSEDLPKMKTHLGRYYKAMDRSAPWDSEHDDLNLILETLAGLPFPLETQKGAVLNAKNKALVKDCLSALQALLATAEPPSVDDEDQALTVTAEQRLREARMSLAQLQLS